MNGIKHRLDVAAFHILTDDHQHEFHATAWAALRLGLGQELVDGKKLTPKEIRGAKPNDNELAAADRYRRTQQLRSCW